jgi:hypothetical protein
MDIYSYDGAWDSWTVRKAATGFVVERTSRFQGSLTDDKYLIPYGTAGYGEDADLHAMHNPGMTVAAFLYHVATDSIGYEGEVKVLRKGHIVA